jgi:hypothetical protein
MSPFLHGKIMKAIRSMETEDARPARSRLAWAVAIGTVCLVAAGTIWLRQPPLTDRIASQPAPAPAELALNVKLPSVDQLDQWTKSLDAPLEQETQLVLRDATAAIHTLAQGFLPAELLGPPAETAQH